jgi:ABC-type uncharacterized transport system YnjBCD ATPase subunit
MCYYDVAALPEGRRGRFRRYARNAKLPNEATKYLKTKDFRFLVGRQTATIALNRRSGEWMA